MIGKIFKEKGRNCSATRMRYPKRVLILSKVIQLIAYINMYAPFCAENT